MVWLIEPGFSSGRQGSSMAEAIVHVFSCTFEEGGETTVPTGSRIVLLFGWAAKNRGLVQAFLNAQTTTISLNGADPVDISDSYGAIRDLPGGFLHPMYATTLVRRFRPASPFRRMARLWFHILSSISSTRPHIGRFCSNPEIQSLSAAALPPQPESPAFPQFA
jgi:hypothetical protein